MNTKKFKAMKNLFFILLVLVFYSCKKCATCTTITTTSASPSAPGYPQTANTTAEYCGDDLKTMDGNETETSSTYSGQTVTIKSKTTCE